MSLDCVHEVFEEQAARTPDATAVVFEGRGTPYGELNARANRLARHLTALGVRRGDTVGVLLERDTELVVAVLAVLKAGAGYTLLDPALPAARVREIASLAGAAHAVTTARLAGRWDGTPVLPVPVDAEADAVAARDAGKRCGCSARRCRGTPSRWSCSGRCCTAAPASSSPGRARSRPSSPN
ncbi:AMP-binding protein [Streptomyces sp. NRRL F-5727]|uniref:AMP-binding protein n=1 Tax=Streptomyces sp. NRRL F-5727 TaxID=1463871 RepID=UPI0018FE1252|nr:AMP-binding protein [Streptomyces sp. NRRL F-5727]